MREDSDGDDVMVSAMANVVMIPRIKNRLPLALTINSVSRSSVGRALNSRWREPEFETLRYSIYKTPDWDGPVGGSSGVQLQSVEWDGLCLALKGT